MREFLEDVHEHMDDGYGRAQAHNQIELRQRFYKAASVGERDGGYCVHLDGRPTKTPGRKMVAVPSEALAAQLVVEWEAQEEFIDPRTMPLVRLVNSAVEAGKNVEDDLRAEIVKFSGNDLLLFRAESPKELVELQSNIWGAAVLKIEQRFDISLEAVAGIVSKNQPKSSLDRLAKELENLNNFALTALVSITGLTGSGLLALGLRRKLFTPDEVWDLAHLDETYNAQTWGADAEAVSRLEKRKVEFDSAVKVLRFTDTA